MKTCTRCGKTKPDTPEYFNIDHRVNGGLVSVCKQCKSGLSRQSYEGDFLRQDRKANVKELIKYYEAQSNMLERAGLKPASVSSVKADEVLERVR